MNYGTEDYYADLFADIIADVQNDRQEYGDNLVAGFRRAITEWREYHVKQVEELNRIEAKLDEES